MLRFSNLHVQINRIIPKPNKSHTNRIIQIVPCKTTWKRLKLAQKCNALIINFWTERISFFSWLASWVHKTDPCQQARTPRTCMWRKKGERLHQECSTKDKKERTVGQMAKFMIECIPYDGNINGELFP